MRSTGRAGRLAPLCLAALLLGCPPRSGPPSPAPAPPGVALRFRKIDVQAGLVEEFVAYVQQLRPGQASDAIRRYILLRHAIPLAWARAQRPEEFQRARERAEGWVAALRRGEFTLEELAARRAVEDGGSPEDAAPVTSSWISLPLPLARAAFQARPGELLGPIETAAGWHLLRVASHTPSPIQSESLVTMLQVVSLAGGLEHLEEVRQFHFDLTRARGSVEVLNPDYLGVVPFYLINNPRGEVAPTAADPDR